MASVENILLPNNVLDTSSLNGLRGLASIHIMMYHIWPTPLMGSVELPLFFLISGFSLTIGYGNTVFQGTSFKRSFSTEENIFPALKFYRNRFARIGPIYYLTNALCLSCQCDVACTPGTPAFWKTAFHTFTMTNAWIFIGSVNHVNDVDWPFEANAWFVTTLSFFYLVFPLLLPALQTLSTHQLSSLIVWLFHFQCWPFLLIMRGTGDSLFWTTTAHPIMRLPVFIMGMAAGLVRLKGKDHNFNTHRNFLHDIFPWGFSQPADYANSTNSEDLESTWRWKVDRNSLLIIGIIMVENIGVYNDSWLCKLWTSQHSQYSTLNLSTPLNTVSQFMLVHMQLTVIVGLTQDGGKSIVSKILRFGPIEFLGQISLTLYLTHEYIRDGIAKKYDLPKFGYYTIALTVATSLVVATVVTKIFTQPLQNLLKTKKQAKPPEIIAVEVDAK